jgi:cytochrome c-type biogenesis protein CcmH/NrfG
LKAAGNLEALDLLGKATVDSLDTLGDIYVTEGLMDLASRAYQRGIDVDAKQPVARPLHSAEVLAARGAMKQARAVAMHVRQVLQPQLDAAAHHKLLKLEARLSMAEGIGDPETAKVLEQVVAEDPLDGEALMLLGQDCSQHGEPDRAIFWYERAESLEAFEINARVRHAQVLVGMGRYADAIPLLRRAQESRPRDDVARYLDQVERIAKSKR